MWSSSSSYFFSLGHCSLSAGEISPSPLCGLILEDDLGLCGYALALTDAKPAAAKIQVIQDVKFFLECSIIINAVTWLYSISKLQRAVSGSVFEDFPSVIALEMLPRVTDPSPAKRMIGQLLSSIRSSGRSRFHTVNLIILDEAHLTAHVEVYEAEN